MAVCGVIIGMRYSAPLLIPANFCEQPEMAAESTVTQMQNSSHLNRPNTSSSRNNVCMLKKNRHCMEVSRNKVSKPKIWNILNRTHFVGLVKGWQLCLMLFAVSCYGLQELSGLIRQPL